jgi:solute carrier family 25 protein 34/35
MIYKNEGLRGLWRGVDASMMRTGVGSAVQLSSYDVCKSKIFSLGIFDPSSPKQQIQLHFSASLLTSFLVCLAMNPFDVASTRMYNQKTAEGQKKVGALYKNGFDCLQKTIRTEGISALYKGFTAHYLRVGPHTILTFVFLEQIKKWNKDRKHA